MNSKWVFGAVAVSIVAVATVWFLKTHERVEESVRTPASAKVKTNVLYGFQEYLSALDIPNQRVIALNTATQLPPTSATLLFADSPSLTADQSDELLSWIAAGGHLALESNVYNWEGSLIQALGLPQPVQVYRQDPEDTQEELSEETDADPNTDEQSVQQSADDTETVADGDAGREAESNAGVTKEEDIYDQDYILSRDGFDLGRQVIPAYYQEFDLAERPVDWTILFRNEKHPNHDSGSFAMGFRYGLGSVTVLNSLTSVDNVNFRKADNAYLLLSALRQNRETGKIWLISAVTRPSLWSIIWNRAAHLVLWLALGVVFFFWWAGQRFGRMLPAPFQGRREYSEHIAASARYLWKHHHQRTLLLDATNNLDHKVERRFPHLRDATEQRRHQFMKALLGDDMALWEKAHDRKDELGKTKFLEHIKAIQILWNKI